MICRVAKVQSWPKLAVQGIAMVSFGIAYLTMETPHIRKRRGGRALAIALFYQARRAKINPKKSLY